MTACTAAMRTVKDHLYVCTASQGKRRREKEVQEAYAAFLFQRMRKEMVE